MKEALTIVDNPMILKYGKNSINAVGFRKSSGDQKSKLKSLANYNCVIIEEAEEIPEEDFMQLDDSLRTVKGDITVILLLNPPPKSHWIVRRWFDLEKHPEVQGFYVPKLKPGMDDTLFLNTNFNDNLANLSEQTIHNYEKYKETKPDHYWNMVVGLVPEVVRGKIYSGWQMIEEVPHEARLECYGLDFGFHPDPAAIVAIYYYNGGYIVDEVLYGQRYLNRHLATTLNNRPEKAVVVADSAEPKSIAEMKELDVDIIPVEKGRDSVNFGIKKVQGMKISVTRRSKNVWREYEDYAWKISKDGEEQGIEDPKCDNHSMSAIRYGLSIIMPSDPIAEISKQKELDVRRREREENVRQNAGL